MCHIKLSVSLKIEMPASAKENDDDEKSKILNDLVAKMIHSVDKLYFC